eukprot:6530613-Alexandrium_andersonii.AAC.1
MRSLHGSGIGSPTCRPWTSHRRSRCRSCAWSSVGCPDGARSATHRRPCRPASSGPGGSTPARTTGMATARSG